MDVFIFSLISILWGGSFILMKVAGQGFTPMAISCFRMLSAALFVLIIWKLQKRKSGLNIKDALAILFVALIGSALPFFIQPWLIHRLNNSSFIGMMVTLVPIYTILASVILLKKKPSSKELLGVLGGLVGVAILFWDSLDKAITLAEFMLATITPLCYALSNVSIKRFLFKADPLFLTAITFAIGGLALIPFLLKTGVFIEGADLLYPSGSLLIMGVFSTGLPGFLFYVLIMRRGPLYAGVVTYIIPIVALSLGFLDDEAISLMQIFCLGFILLMVSLVQRGRREAN